MLIANETEKKDAALNLYGFVVNNPLFFIDTDGRLIRGMQGFAATFRKIQSYMQKPKDIVVENNWNIGAYGGVGAECSNEWVKCCEKSIEYNYHLLVICFGIGGSVSATDVPIPSTTDINIEARSNKNCPRNNDWFIAKSGSAKFFYGGGYQVDLGRNEGLGGQFTTNYGGVSAGIVLLKACSVTVLDQERTGGCCE